MTRLPRRAWLATPLAAPALAQPGFPNRPIRLVVPWLPGGSADHLRLLAELAGRNLGQPVITENRPGVSGTLGPALLAQEARGDGHLIGQIPITAFRIPAMLRRPPFDPMADFTWVIHLSGYGFGVVVRGDSPYRRWEDLLARAKAAPGRVSYASPGAGSSPHIAMERITAEAGASFLHVPYRGGTDTAQALLSGAVDCTADSTSWAPLVQDGTFRLLVTWGAERARRFPEVRTLREVGIDLVSDSPFGLAAPKHTDAGLVRALHDAIKPALFDPRHVAMLDRFDMPLRYMGPEEYAAFARRLNEEEGRAVRRLGLRMD
ncbi:tripartite tricarboxylate transporter substrate binding protein [Roseococcus sp. SYP-B2431]|uniref:tripartite tricarboxylate transporter substrate binding protein n=1 Tax=Roseococcus sp. SYP-B2431 TaxID=2496640 RepID=UPI00103866DF|nr:tripartite tricarboxylate transporter substrate binding protein [Roseococcus sp. SYP-B2431]TCI00189.1 tripartite tricarboxylate transporter substrate binding protein [Roseococcus sp. SYP-B2431]